MTNVTRDLAHWVAGVEPSRLPEAVSHQARRVLLDYLAAALAGSTTATATAVREYLSATEGEGAATVIGSRRRLSPAAAAFANGTAAHGLEIDDGHTAGSIHPGAVTLPAVMAAAEAYDATPEVLTTAIVVAFEVACRLSAAAHPATRHRGWHNTPVHGVFGAAAGVAKVLRLDAETCASAFGVAASFAGGLFEFLGTGAEVKRVHPGKGARDGLVSVELARRGVTGPSTALEGRNGFFKAFAGGEVNVGRLFDGLGERFEIMRTYVKPYPCCRHLHAPIDAVLALKASAPIDPAAVESVRVETISVAMPHDHRDARQFIDAQMSIPYAVAVALTRGEPGIAEFSSATRRDPLVQALMQKVDVVTAPDCEADYPRLRPARVRIRLRDGSERSLRVDEPLGEPGRPLSDAALEEKFRRVCGPVAGAAWCARVIEAVWALDDLRALFAGLRVSEAELRPAVD